MRLAATLHLFGSEQIGSFAGIECTAWIHSPKRIDVLKIQRTSNGVTVIALSGRMETEHILELKRLLEAESPGRPIVLDLKHLTLAGQSEIDFFAQCEERGVTLANCAPYIREWLTSQRNGRQSNDF
jgi:hypothetical protein